MKKAFLFSLFWYTTSAFTSSQFADFQIKNLKCQSKSDQISPISIEEQQINLHYKISLIQFKKNNKEYTLSALATVLDKKCLIYFYAYNPSTELFEIRFNYKNNQLLGTLYYQKGEEKWSTDVSCPISKDQVELLPSRCLPLKSPKTQKDEKQAQQPRKIYQLTPPKIIGEDYESTGDGIKSVGSE